MAMHNNVCTLHTSLATSAECHIQITTLMMRAAAAAVHYLELVHLTLVQPSIVMDGTIHHGTWTIITVHECNNFTNNFIII
jgi:hypothetical protein